MYDRKKLVYLCGGINGLTDNACKDWRETAKTLLEWPTLDPMRRDYRGQEQANVYKLVDADYNDIATATHLLVNANTASWGTAMEIHEAYLQNKIIVAFCNKPPEAISPWLTYHCSYIVPTLEEACKTINNNIKDVLFWL
jgi:hypothetical protein